MSEEIKAILIFEMLGRPAEHLKNTFGQFIDKISQEDGLEILNRKINEPKKVEQAQQELFTTFSEVEINFKNLLSLLKIIFVYMPSHIEITNPSELKIKNFELNSIMTELARKLHQYDEVAKRLAIERAILQRQLQQQGIQPAIPLTEQQEQVQQQEAQKTKKAKRRKKK